MYPRQPRLCLCICVDMFMGFQLNIPVKFKDLKLSSNNLNYLRMNWRAFQSVFKKFVSNSINDGNSGVVDISKYKNNNVHIHNLIGNVYSYSIALRGPF